MFSIIQIGSEQFKVTQGDVIFTNRLKSDKDKTVAIDKVLYYENGTDVRIGQPFLKDVKVTAKVVDHVLDKKVFTFKYSRRKSSSMQKGHRQKLTSLNITKITAN
ncbi:MAG: 50S ribosomal protein L21 [Omnitrophica WOR_2 bacterium GWA2_47_8]|nr:MAG: 50S ribosomal protein L21 [Omnitrophica WOR_2 bacterium GWA2_47_8]